MRNGISISFSFLDLMQGILRRSGYLRRLWGTPKDVLMSAILLINLFPLCLATNRKRGKGFSF